MELHPDTPQPPEKNIFYSLQALRLRTASQFFRTFWKILNIRPDSRPYLSGDTFRNLCKFCWDEQVQRSPFKPSEIKAGDLVYVAANHVKEFFQVFGNEALPPLVLITGNEDANITEDVFLSRPSWVKHWFAQNALFYHPELTPIPIGLENRRHHWHGRTDDFRRLSSRVEVKWPGRILFGFASGNNPAQRNPALAVLRSLDWASPSGNLNSWNYRRYLKKFGLVASPPGNGEDCHRTWEALYLGVAPVVKRSVLSEYFSRLGLALAVVDSWEELRTWSPEYRAGLSAEAQNNKNHPALFFPYWEKKIRAQQELIQNTARGRKNG